MDLPDCVGLRECRVILGGQQRGGLSVAHWETPTHGEQVIDTVEYLVGEIREQLEQEFCRVSPVQTRVRSTPTT
jgi:hypothetical protein